MTLLIKNKKAFLSSFLSSISKISNSCILSITNKGISSLLASPDGSLILYSFYEQDIDCEPVKLNMPDLGRLIKILQCIEGDELVLEVESNAIKYSSKKLRFTYHLLHEGIIPQCPISVEKIKAIDYQTTFTILNDKLIEIVRCSTFASGTTKIYFSTEEGAVYGELTDKQRANVDGIRLELSDSFKGEVLPKAIPMSYETIRIITTTRCDGVNVFVNIPKTVVMFETTNANVKNIYISSGLTG